MPPEGIEAVPVSVSMPPDWPEVAVPVRPGTVLQSSGPGIVLILVLVLVLVLVLLG
jgi:hypothetical protein